MVSIAVGTLRPPGGNQYFAVVTVCIARTECLSVTFGRLFSRLDEFIGIAVVGILRDELFASRNHAVPALGIVITIPRHFPDTLLGDLADIAQYRLLRLGIRLVRIEQGAGRIEQHTNLERQRRSFRKTPVIGRVDRPRELPGSLFAQRDDVFDRLFESPARIVYIGLLTRLDGCLEQGNPTEVAQQFVVLARNDHSGLALAPNLFRLAHVGHTVNILDVEERLADTRPRHVLLGVEPHLRTARLILGLGVVCAPVIHAVNAAPRTMRADDIGQGIEVVPCQFVTGILVFVRPAVNAGIVHREPAAQRGIGRIEGPVGIELRREDRVDGHIAAGRFLQEPVPEFQVAAIGQSRHETAQDQNGYYRLFHSGVSIRM